MFEYDICNQADHDIFIKQCAALEKHIPRLTKGDLLTDVDGSEIQAYDLDGATIKVYNDHYVDAVHIKSEVDLKPFFN